MTKLLSCAVIALWTGLAHADAIIPVEGDCPPGTRKAMVGHGEECVPDSCTDDDDCGRGAHCASFCECRAEREVYVHRQGPQMAVVPIGMCNASGACSEGQPSTKRQCEPTESTPAFDTTNHRWTGQPHPSSWCSASGTPSAWLGVWLAIVLVRRRSA